MDVDSLQLPDEVRVALREFRTGLERTFGARLLDVRLFGSRARGDARPDSDADVLVVLGGTVSRADFVAVTDLCGDLLVAHDVLIDPFLTPLDTYERHREQERPLQMDIEREGVTL